MLKTQKKQRSAVAGRLLRARGRAARRGGLRALRRPPLRRPVSFLSIFEFLLRIFEFVCVLFKHRSLFVDLFIYVCMLLNMFVFCFVCFLICLRILLIILVLFACLLYLYVFLFVFKSF